MIYVRKTIIGWTVSQKPGHLFYIKQTDNEIFHMK